MNPNYWRIYYNDESTFDAEQGEPWDAPKTGVLAVVYYNVDNRREIGASKDFYWYDEQPVYKDIKGGSWFAGDVSGYYQYMFGKGRKTVLFGAIVHDVIWRRMLKRITTELPESLDYKTKLPESII